MSETLVPQPVVPDGEFIHRWGFQTWLIFGLFLSGVVVFVAEGALAVLWSGQDFPSYGSAVMNSLALAGVVLVYTAVGLSIKGILVRRRSRIR